MTTSTATASGQFLVDLLGRVLKVGRPIVAAPSAAAVDSAARHAALALLPIEHCYLINVRGPLDAQLPSESGDPIDHVSRALLARAIEAGAPIMVGKPTGNHSDNHLLAPIRSVLVAPVVVRGKTVSCLYVTHSVVGQPFSDEEVQIAAFIAVLAGVAFQNLEAPDQLFRSLTQHASDVLTLVDRHGIITYQSSAAVRIFELPPSGLTGRPILEWIHPDDRVMVTSAIERMTSSNELRLECRFQHSDGSYVYAETTVTNLLDEPAVEALMFNIRDVTDRRQREKDLRERALHDSLTGLPNRALFLERAQHSLNRRSRRPLVVCFLDLDDFKIVNDTFGHGAGDQLLCEFGTRLSTCLRPEDTVARFGGDEFAILLEDTDITAALVIVERILASTSLPMAVADTSVVIQASIGLAPSEPRHWSIDQLLAEADAAMYIAKSRGRHGFEIYTPEIRVMAGVQARIRTDIDLAIEHAQFRLHYQPIMSLGKGAGLGVEALIRWQHPERGLLSPVDFMDLAEASGQITAIGNWVLATACGVSAQLPPGTQVSVNVSARQLRQPDLVEVIAEALRASRLPAAQLILDISERTAVTDIQGATTRLHELKELGLHIALDDYGTGHVPLSYLQRLPVDILKIDRSLIECIGSNGPDDTLVRGVIDVAHALDLRTVAEGVEHAVQQEVLVGLGCDLGQGYFWMRPAPLTDISAWSIPGWRGGEGAN